MLLRELWDVAVNEISAIPSFTHDSDELMPARAEWFQNLIQNYSVDKFYLSGSSRKLIAHIAKTSDTGTKSFYIILTDQQKNILGYAAAEIPQIQSKPCVVVFGVWVSRRLQGQNLGARIYKALSQRLDLPVVSDDMQTPGGQSIWTRGLSKLGITPVAFDIRKGPVEVSAKEIYSHPDLRLAFHVGYPDLKEYFETASEEPAHDA